MPYICFINHKPKFIAKVRYYIIEQLYDSFGGRPHSLTSSHEEDNKLLFTVVLAQLNLSLLFVICTQFVHPNHPLRFIVMNMVNNSIQSCMAP